MIILNENKKDIEYAASELKKGKILVFPTDTVYGVGSDYKNKDAIKKIYEYKIRDKDKPLILLISKIEHLSEIIKLENDLEKKMIEKLSKKFWPGSLSLILKKNREKLKDLNPEYDTIGVRIPNNNIVLELIEKAGGIIATTSANISNKKAPKNFYELDDEFINKVDYVIKSERKIIGTPSTIIKISEKGYKILRVGNVTEEEIKKVLE